MSQKIFLGGTIKNNWREELIGNLHKSIAYFNPVVDNWTESDRINEEEQKAKHCNIHLYVLTSDTKGFYSVAEIMHSVNNKNKLTILHVLPVGFSDAALVSLNAVVNLVRENGGIAYVDTDLKRTATLLNLLR